MPESSPRERLAGALALVRNTLELPVKAGVSARQVANAINGRPVATIAYLRLCMAIGLDPMPGRLLLARQRPCNFDFGMFSLGFRLRRRVNRHSEREAANLIGVSASTVCRIEAGTKMQIGVVLRTCAYIDAHVYHYCQLPAGFTGNTSIDSEKASA